MLEPSKRTKNRLSTCHFTQFWYDSSGPSRNRPLWQHNKKGTMAGHSILYLGRGEFATDYLGELESLPFCALLTRSAELEVPADAPSIIDVILLEAGHKTAEHEVTAATDLHAYFQRRASTQTVEPTA